jgi:hypothetical protein
MSEQSTGYAALDFAITEYGDEDQAIRGFAKKLPDCVKGLNLLADKATSMENDLGLTALVPS